MKPDPPTDSGNPFLLYSDFNCPFCYALHERLHDMKLDEQFEWRGVQHAPYLPRRMSNWKGNREGELRHEVALVTRLAPGLPIALPPGKPNTRLAIEQAARLLDEDRQRGMEYVRLAYRSFWRDGEDLSDPSIIERLVRQVGGSIGGASSSGAGPRHIAQGWEAAWQETEQAGVPLIVSPDGRLLVGCLPPDDIRRFMS